MLNIKLMCRCAFSITKLKCVPTTDTENNQNENEELHNREQKNEPSPNH